MPLVGVDMSIPANSPVGNILALADCDRWLGAPAAFVGRYLGDGGHVAIPLTPDEAAWILSQGRGIIVVFNNATATSVAAGWPQGKDEAEQAIRLAEAVGLPKGCTIWLDCEAGWAIHPDYIKAWVETILQAGYIPGLYGALATQQFADAFNAAEIADRGNVDRCRLWSASWVSVGTSAATAPAWNPQRPGPNGPAPSVWQFTGSTFNGIADEDEVQGALADIGAWMPALAPQSPATASTSPAGPITPAPPVPPTSAAPGSSDSADWQERALAAEGKLLAIKQAGGW